MDIGVPKNTIFGKTDHFILNAVYSMFFNTITATEVVSTTAHYYMIFHSRSV